VHARTELAHAHGLIMHSHDIHDLVVHSKFYVWINDDMPIVTTV
jgi:hypothetical protein